MNEQWRDVPGFGGHYQASTLGRIRSKDRVVIKPHSKTGNPTPYKYKGKVLSQYRDSWGYLRLSIAVGGEVYGQGVHVLVLLAFVGPRPDGMEACHCNGIADDNRPENLRWDTHLANNRDRKRHGTYLTGVAHPMAKFSDEIIQKVRADRCSGKHASQKYGISETHVSRIRRGTGRSTVRNNGSELDLLNETLSELMR